MQRLTDEIGVPLIVGAAQVEKFATGESEITVGHHIFNTAYLLKPGESLGQPYRKRVLVPFAEYLPHADTIPWPEWLAPRVAEMTPGDHAQLFRVTSNLTVGTLICWENLFASLPGTPFVTARTCSYNSRTTSGSATAQRRANII